MVSHNNNVILTSLEIEGEEQAKQEFATKVYIEDEKEREQFLGENPKGPKSTEEIKNTIFVCKVVFIIAIALALYGVLVVRVFGVWHINSALNFPSTNCTVERLIPAHSKSGPYNKTVVSYYDSHNISHQKTIETYVTFAVGEQFLCLYKGNFVEIYSTIKDELTTTRRSWWLAVVIPESILAFIASIILICIWLNRICAKNLQRNEMAHKDNAQNSVRNKQVPVPKYMQTMNSFFSQYVPSVVNVVLLLVIMLGLGVTGLGWWLISYYSFDMLMFGEMYSLFGMAMVTGLILKYCKSER